MSSFPVLTKFKLSNAIAGLVPITLQSSDTWNNVYTKIAKQILLDPGAFRLFVTYKPEPEYEQQRNYQQQRNDDTPLTEEDIFYLEGSYFLYVSIKFGIKLKVLDKNDAISVPFNESDIYTLVDIKNAVKNRFDIPDHINFEVKREGENIHSGQKYSLDVIRSFPIEAEGDAEFDEFVSNYYIATEREREAYNKLKEHEYAVKHNVIKRNEYAAAAAENAARIAAMMAARKPRTGGRAPSRRRTASKAPLTDAAITDSIRFDFNEMELPTLASARKIPGFKSAEVKYRALRHEWDGAYHVLVKNRGSREARKDYNAIMDSVAHAFTKLSNLAKSKSMSRSRSRSKQSRLRSRSKAKRAVPRRYRR